MRCYFENNEVEMSPEIEVSFLDHFQDIEDPRLERNRAYTMSEILLVPLCAVIGGAEGVAGC